MKNERSKSIASMTVSALIMLHKEVEGLLHNNNDLENATVKSLASLELRLRALERRCITVRDMVVTLKRTKERK